MVTSFQRLASVTANTQRVPIVGGISGPPVTVLSGIKITQFAPIDPMLSTEYGLGFKELLRTSTEGNYDLLEGDMLIVGSGKYQIRSVENWHWSPTNVAHYILTCEEVK